MLSEVSSVGGVQQQHGKCAKIVGVPSLQVVLEVVLQGAVVILPVGTSIFCLMLCGSSCAGSHDGQSGQWGYHERVGIEFQPWNSFQLFAVTLIGNYGRSMPGSCCRMDNLAGLLSFSQQNPFTKLWSFFLHRGWSKTFSGPCCCAGIVPVLFSAKFGGCVECSGEISPICPISISVTSRSLCPIGAGSLGWLWRGGICCTHQDGDCTIFLSGHRSH